MTRMLCLGCGATTFAETRLPGSDRLERVGWLLGGLPGWAICVWRHALRTKHCGVCGSPVLARETRASAARDPAAPPVAGVPIVSDAGDGRWPAHLREPRARLRRGAASLAVWALLAAGLFGLGGALAAAWLSREMLLALQRGKGEPACEAWDAAGRRLRIEVA